MAPPRCPPCSPPWRAPGSPSGPPPSPGPRWTTCTCATPAAGSPTPTSPPSRPSLEHRNDDHRRTHHLDDRAPAQGDRPPARLHRHHADPAGHLAVPVRLAVPQGCRVARLRGRVLYGLPGPGRGDHERAVVKHVERYDGA